MLNEKINGVILVSYLILIIVTIVFLVSKEITFIRFQAAIGIIALVGLMILSVLGWNNNGKEEKG